jgi:hypothetical protein
MDYATLSAATFQVPVANDVWSMFWANPLVQHILSPAVTFSLVLAVVYKTFDLGSLKEKFSRALKDIDQLDKNMSDLDKNVGKLVTHMAIVKTHLVDKTGMDANLFAAHSPLSLLPKGKELFKKSGFETIFKENKPWFIDELKKSKVTTLAELDEASHSLVQECLDKNLYADYKDIAFRNGVSLEVLLRVIAIWLRDETADIIFKK